MANSDMETWTIDTGNGIYREGQQFLKKTI